MAALDDGLDQINQRFEPDLILYLGGADPHEGDRLGRLALTDAGMQARDQRVFEWVWNRQALMAMVMAGG